MGLLVDLVEEYRAGRLTFGDLRLEIEAFKFAPPPPVPKGPEAGYSDGHEFAMSGPAIEDTAIEFDQLRARGLLTTAEHLKLAEALDR